MSSRRKLRSAERLFDIQGGDGIDAVVARATSAIRALWDGSDQSVAIIARLSETQARVAFLGRHETIDQLRRSTRIRRLKSRSILEHIAHLLEEDARRGVPCLLLGFGDPALVELELADGLRDPPRLEDVLARDDTCPAARAALSELNELRQLVYLEFERRIPELESLAHVLLLEWESLWAVVRATRDAHVAAAVLGVGRLRDRAERFLETLDRATAERCGDPINAPGGCA